MCYVIALQLAFVEFLQRVDAGFLVLHSVSDVVPQKAVLCHLDDLKKILHSPVLLAISVRPSSGRGAARSITILPSPLSRVFKEFAELREVPHQCLDGTEILNGLLRGGSFAGNLAEEGPKEINQSCRNEVVEPKRQGVILDFLVHVGQFPFLDLLGQSRQGLCKTGRRRGKTGGLGKRMEGRVIALEMFLLRILFQIEH